MAAINAVTDLTREGDIAVLTINSPPVNALSADVRSGLRDGAQQAAADPAVKAIVLICAGRTFIAGADISEFGKPSKGASVPEIQNALENNPKPIIAAIHGTALGGGFEVALTCHYRVAVPSAKFGLPEIKLGLIPGAGGTQRLPRLSGVENALNIILSGTPFDAKQALEWGVIDTVVEEGKLRDGAMAFARKVIDTQMPLSKIRDRNDKIEAARGKPEIFEKIRKDNARKFRGFEAWKSAMRAVQAAVDLPFDDGMKLERQLFLDLVPSEQSRAQRYVFFAERKVWKVADVPDDTPVLPIKKVGVIGAGTMGGGIAMNFLNVGIPVTIVETAQAALDRGLTTIRRNYENTAKKGRLTQADVETRMGLLSPDLNLDALSDCDLIIEAVFENMDIKKDVFRKLDKVAKPGAILASNTSYLNIDEIASVDQPARSCARHAFLLAGKRDAASGSGARGENRKAGDRNRDAARAQDRQDRGFGRGVSRLCRQSHAGAAPARSAETHSRGRHALGRRPRHLRFRPADGSLRHERSRRARHRLVEGDQQVVDHPRNPVRDGPARPENRRRILRL